MVRALAQAALDSDVVKAAAVRPHWRETYVGTVPTEGEHTGKVLEGFVDLIYRDDNGSLVVVDYKTDDIPAEAVAARAAHYAPQLRSYRAILHRGTHAPTHSRLLFVAPGRSPTRPDAEGPQGA